MDLAGSERVGRSGAEGGRLREARHINKSLSALGDVMDALRRKRPHVPFRNSRLTFLLQDSLQGDSKTLMMVQVRQNAGRLSKAAARVSPLCPAPFALGVSGRGRRWRVAVLAQVRPARSQRGAQRLQAAAGQPLGFVLAHAAMPRGGLTSFNVAPPLPCAFLAKLKPSLKCPPPPPSLRLKHFRLFFLCL